MIFLAELLFYFNVFYGIIASPHVNLDLTDWTNDGEIHIGLQHDCLYVPAITERAIQSYQIISYCLTEWPSKWPIKENQLDQKFTFAELDEQHVTSEQLYLWSAPMNIIEHYQSYLNQQSTISNELTSMETHVFYNCTSPRFGPQCQYSLDIYQPHHVSLTQLVREFYGNRYAPTTLTCYMHLECNHGGSTSICLSWYEICNGIVDCLNDAIDEKHCWTLKINECKENEYQCQNGQCIPRAFFRDNYLTLECLDESDQDHRVPYSLVSFTSNEPTFLNEDLQLNWYENLGALGLGLASSILRRMELLNTIKFIETPMSLSDDCWLAFKCKYNILKEFDTQCKEYNLNESLIDTIKNECPDMLFMPATPLVFGHLYFAYQKEMILNSTNLLTPHYVCYHDRFCDGFSSNSTLLSWNNLTCRKSQDFPLSFEGEHAYVDIDFYIRHIYKQLYQCNTIIDDNNSTKCNSSIMYQCLNSSKCILIDHLCDGRNDCNYKDDEQCTLMNGTCSVMESNMLFKCISASKCISIHLINNGYCDCGFPHLNSCEDEMTPLDSRINYVPFSSICNGYTQLFPLTIDDRSETDETECDYWQCNNTYTRCNKQWNCFDGADEINCHVNPSLTCALDHHVCVSPKTYQLMCLPLQQANDGRIDCVGATDEPQLCRLTESISAKNFFCKNNTVHGCILSGELCAENNRCIHGEDEQLCYQTRNITGLRSICEGNYYFHRSPVQTFFCQRNVDGFSSRLEPFTLKDIEYPMTRSIEHVDSTMSMPSSHISINNAYEQRCHRGLPLRVWSDSENHLSTEACLCPPSYYGETCQYENQRVSFTVQFQAYSDSRRTLFTILISLIDIDENQRTIYSYQQHTYYYLRDCSMKYNIYLLYPTRPRDSSKNYSIHLDVYEKISLVYRGSFSIPIEFPFLPINRIAVQLTIPRQSKSIGSCSDQSCRNGRCVKYVDDSRGYTFCQCDQGWSGKYCTIPHTCQCSSDSLCVGVSANNQSVCICPMSKWGSRCLLHSDPCQFRENEPPCLNGGQCVPDDKQLILSDKFFCLCRKGYSGERCENVDTYLTLSFHKDIILPQSMIIHFLDVIKGNDDLAVNSSVVHTISLYQKLITIYWTEPFHIALAQFSDHYYLLIVQKTYDRSLTYHRTIMPSDRCQSLREVFNDTIISLHPFRRMKYYQIPCQRYAPHLNCFYDDHYFCLCYNYNGQRLSNCFNFNSRIQQTCYGLSDCENNAPCIQDHPSCPKASICVCPKCFHGTRCQFSSHLFGLSLDAILGYHIQPHVHLRDQSSIIQTSLALTIIIALAGMINGILSVITFKNKALRESGCGLYLWSSSLTTLFTMIIFLLKYSILINAQMISMTNRLFLNVQCYTLDFLLHIGLNMDQYLNACVAMERAFIVIKKTGFNKKKSKQLAKYMIVSLLIWTMSTTIHDPIHRRLLDDDQIEKRIWCIVSYSSNLRIYSSIINSIHFFIPFVLNLISALIIIIMTTRQRRQAQQHQAHRQILQEQLQEHKHLLIAPIVLVILALPRLILSSIADCMTTTSHAWLPLVGYFISFTPPTLIILIFVLPSKLYTKELQKSLRQFHSGMRACLHWRSE